MTTTNDRGFIPADPALAWARFERYRARQQDLSDNHGDICGMSDITRRLQAKLADEERLTAEMGLFSYWLTAMKTSPLYISLINEF